MAPVPEGPLEHSSPCRLTERWLPPRLFHQQNIFKLSEILLLSLPTPYVSDKNHKIQNNFGAPVGNSSVVAFLLPTFLPQYLCEVNSSQTDLYQGKVTFLFWLKPETHYGLPVSFLSPLCSLSFSLLEYCYTSEAQGSVPTILSLKATMRLPDKSHKT